MLFRGGTDSSDFILSALLLINKYLTYKHFEYFITVL